LQVYLERLDRAAEALTREIAGAEGQLLESRVEALVEAELSPDDLKALLDLNVFAGLDTDGLIETRDGLQAQLDAVNRAREVISGKLGSPASR